MKISSLLNKKAVADIVIYPSKLSKNLDDVFDQLYDLSYNGILIDPKDNETPNCWDSGFTIKGDKFIIVGGVGPSGFGNVRIELPLNSVKDYYKIYIEPKDKNSIPLIKQIINDHKWIIIGD